MKTKPNDPVDWRHYINSMTGKDGTFYEGSNQGLTKREFFSAMALIGLSIQEHFQTYTSNQKAEKAVQYADELIKSLNQENPSIFNKSIDFLVLNVRTFNCLISSDIKTIGQLVSKTEEDLLNIRSFGKVCLAEIKEELNRYNLKLTIKKDVL